MRAYTNNFKSCEGVRNSITSLLLPQKPYKHLINQQYTESITSLLFHYFPLLVMKYKKQTTLLIEYLMPTQTNTYKYR